MQACFSCAFFSQNQKPYALGLLKEKNHHDSALLLEKVSIKNLPFSAAHIQLAKKALYKQKKGSKKDFKKIPIRKFLYQC